MQTAKAILFRLPGLISSKLQKKLFPFDSKDFLISIAIDPIFHSYPPPLSNQHSIETVIELQNHTGYPVKILGLRYTVSIQTAHITEMEKMIFETIFPGEKKTFSIKKNLDPHELQRIMQQIGNDSHLKSDIYIVTYASHQFDTVTIAKNEQRALSYNEKEFKTTNNDKAAIRKRK